MNTWAIISTGGKQYKITEGQTLVVDKFNDQGKGRIDFDRVLLVKEDKNLTVGKPYVEKAKVTAKVLENFKDKKVRVVKFKPKSRYLRVSGHRQAKTKVLIEKIQIT